MTSDESFGQAVVASLGPKGQWRLICKYTPSWRPPGAKTGAITVIGKNLLMMWVSGEGSNRPSRPWGNNFATASVPSLQVASGKPGMLVFSAQIVHYGQNSEFPGGFVKVVLVVSLLLIVLAGCSPVRGQLSAWQGARLGDLIAQVGPPSAVSSDETGTKYYHWYEDRGEVYTYSGQVSLRCERTFGVNAQEIIMSWRWSGNCLALPDSPWQRNTSSAE